ncbi:MAG: bifunctional pyr operon transcriptional regulator/uracil phosphoribosyltransferase PyrR [Bacillota bacterium]
MTPKKGREILGADGIRRALLRIAHEIIEKNEGTDDLVLVGVRTRGVPLAERLVNMIKDIENSKIPLGILDITLYRDDLSTISQQPVVHKTEIPFDITGKKVILIDDVLYTGRTIRSALDALVDFGRPDLIELAALIDRGHRELPIYANYVGKKVPTTENQVIHVNLKETDDVDKVYLEENQKF